MSDQRPATFRSTTRAALRLTLGALTLIVAVLLPVAVDAVAVDASAVDHGPLRIAAIQVTQASETNEPAPAPQFQPVGKGDAITSPALPDDGSDADGSSGTWWRIVFGAAVVAVVLVALIQRRQIPERDRGIGPGRSDRPNNRPNNRNVLGH